LTFNDLNCCQTEVETGGGKQTAVRQRWRQGVASRGRGWDPARKLFFQPSLDNLYN